MTMIMRNLLFLLLLFCLSCNREDAPDLFQTRGDYVERTQSIGQIRGINAGRGIDVILQQGNEPQLLIKGWKNLLPDVKIYLDKDGILHLKDENKHNYVRSYSNRTTVYVTYAVQPEYFRVESDANMQSLDVFYNSFSILGEEGGGEMSFLADCPHILIGVNAVIDVFITGKTDYLHITNWGWAPLRFENLECRQASITHHGPSNIFVNVQDILNAELTSSGNIYYTGNPVVNEVRRAKGRVYQR